MKELPSEDLQSFYMLAGYHGEPFRGAGWGNAVIGAATATTAISCFPPGTACIVLKLEEALQSVPGAPTSCCPIGTRRARTP